MRATAVNSSSVEVIWEPPVDGKRNGVIRGYQIYVQPKNTVRKNGGSEARCDSFHLIQFTGFAVLHDAAEVQHGLGRGDPVQRDRAAAGHKIHCTGIICSSDTAGS